MQKIHGINWPINMKNIYELSLSKENGNIQ